MLVGTRGVCEQTTRWVASCARRIEESDYWVHFLGWEIGADAR